MCYCCNPVCNKWSFAFFLLASFVLITVGAFHCSFVTRLELSDWKWWQQDTPYSYGQLGNVRPAGSDGCQKSGDGVASSVSAFAAAMSVLMLSFAVVLAAVEFGLSKYLNPQKFTRRMVAFWTALTLGIFFALMEFYIFRSCIENDWPDFGFSILNDSYGTTFCGVGPAATSTIFGILSLLITSCFGCSAPWPHKGGAQGEAILVVPLPESTATDKETKREESEILLSSLPPGSLGVSLNPTSFTNDDGSFVHTIASIKEGSPLIGYALAGDILIKLNDQDLTRLNHDQVLALMKSTKEDTSRALRLRRSLLNA